MAVEAVGASGASDASGASGASSAIKANPGKVFSATETFISTFYVETFPT